MYSYSIFVRNEAPFPRQPEIVLRRAVVVTVHFLDADRRLIVELHFQRCIAGSAARCRFESSDATAFF